MTWRWIAIGGAGLVVGLGAALLSILLVTRGGPTTTLGAASPPPIAPIPPAAPPTASLEPSAPTLPPPSRPMTRGMGRAARATLTRELGAEMGDLRSQLERCPDRHLHRRDAESAARDAATMIEAVQRQIAAGADAEVALPPIAGGEAREGVTQLPTILMLEVETSNSQMRIVDAALAMPGAASDAFVACARQVLRGQIVAVPAAPPGKHLRIPVDLDGAGIPGQLQRHGGRRRR